MDSVEGATIVVPCFNEAHRFEDSPFLQLVQQRNMNLLMVNDGSTDETGERLDCLARQSGSIAVLNLPTNRGKGEAVRRGLLQAIDECAPLVGYYDADASTPQEELVRLVNILRGNPRLVAVFGSRVSRLGSNIRRSPVRHYGGRVYATLASLALGVSVYDTQCGAKVFRSSPALSNALAKPFPSRWTFDIWLIYRLIGGSDGEPPFDPGTFLEVPLEAWRDVGGSGLRPVDAVVAFVEILGLMVRRASDARK